MMCVEFFSLDGERNDARTTPHREHWRSLFEAELLLVSALWGTIQLSRLELSERHTVVSHNA